VIAFRFQGHHQVDYLTSLKSVPTAVALPLSQYINCCPSSPFTPLISNILRPAHFVVRVVAAGLQSHSLTAHPPCSPIHPSIRRRRRTRPLSRYMPYLLRKGVLPSNDPDKLLSFFMSFAMAAMVSAPDLPHWIRDKMAHFEKRECFFFKPVWKIIATEWDMVEIEMNDFQPEKQSSSGYSDPYSKSL
jgi:hypothetical protein